MTKEKELVLHKLKTQPYLFARSLGFTKLTPMNNEWIIDMVFGGGDETLQAHRGSYKTTCVSVALCLIIILFPNDKTKFFRKTDTAVKEVIRQVSMMLKHPLTRGLVREIWGVELKLITDSAFEIHTNLTNDPRGAKQLSASGFKSTKTGQHFDRIFTDDIVTVEDRTSRAEREATIQSYYELQNIINPDGRIFNSGTPWHKEDAFEIMPDPKKYDCYTTGLMSEAEIQNKKDILPPSLFAANYELKHIADDDIIFDNPNINADADNIMDSNYCHIDAAYGGEDWTAFTIVKKVDDIYYVYGRCWQKHVDDCLPDILADKERFRAGKLYCETNADKGYLAKELRKDGVKVATYWESMNKYMKIVTYLKYVWKNVIFVEGTDEQYINMILEFNENVEHDDCPDSLASLIRILWNKKNSSSEMTASNSIFL